MSENSVASQKQIQSPVQDAIPQTLNSNSTNPGIVTSPTQTPMRSNSPSLDIPQQKLLMQQQVQQQHQNLVMQRSPSLSRFTHVQQVQSAQGQFGLGGGGQHGDGGGGMFGKSNFGGSVMSQQQQLQIRQQLQQHHQQQQTNVSDAGNIGRGGLMGHNGQMLQGQLNMQSQMLVPPMKKAVLAHGVQYYAGNMSCQMLQGMQSGVMTGSLNMPQQIRNNEALNFTQQVQHMNQGIMRQQMLQQSPFNSQVQNLTMTSSSLAFMNPQMSGLAQNGQPTMMQNSLTQQQQQWLTQMPGMNTPASPSHHLQQQRHLMQQQTASSGQMNQNHLALNQQRLNQLVQNQSATPQQQQHQQQMLAQQVVTNQQQRSPRMVGTLNPRPNGRKTYSLTGSQPDASGATTPGGSSSQGTEATNQLLGKRKIQDLVSQVDLHAKLNPEVEDILLELGDSFIESVTTSAITLAKHRNSSMLEAKDLSLHLEKNWNLKIPGYSSGWQKNPDKPALNEIHKKRLDMIRRLMEPSQLKGNANSTKDAATTMHGMDGQHNLNHQLMRPSPSSEKLVTQSASGSQILHQHQLAHF